MSCFIHERSATTRKRKGLATCFLYWTKTTIKMTPTNARQKMVESMKQLFIVIFFTCSSFYASLIVRMFFFITALQF